MRHRTGCVLPVEAGTRTFPERPPQDPNIRFNAESWPPTPEGWAHVRSMHAEALDNSISSDLETLLREAALRDVRVQQALGERFAFITSDAIGIGKGQRNSGTEALSSRLMFFSHARNSAVEVILKGTAVQRVQEKKEYQPKEGHEEIVEAIRLARRDDSLRGHVELLDAHAILQPNRTEDIGCGHRTIWVTFTESGDADHEKPALFAATVDMIARTVSTAGKVPSATPGTGGTSVE